MKQWTIRPAGPADLEPLARVLEAAELPVAGVADHLSDFLVADDAGRIAATAGLECYGNHALLRSVAVDPQARGSGLGARMVAAALEQARSRHMATVSLLTTTADGYFPRFGFAVVGHDAVPAPVKVSSQFNGVCPASAVAMTLALSGPAAPGHHENATGNTHMRLLTATLAMATLAAAPMTAQTAAPPVGDQIAAAVLPLPAQLRASARVLGYPAGATRLSVIREGAGMVCLASNPGGERFHVACYHESMEPFMARGRALREGGTQGDQVDSVRFREARGGRLALPSHPAALYSLTGGAFDPKTGTAPGARHLYVVYIPNATGASTGLAERPDGSQPWLMFPGTPKAHIMFTPGM